MIFDAQEMGSCDINIQPTQLLPFWQTSCLCFGILGVPGTIQEHIREHKKGDLGVLILIFIDFGSISGSNFESLGTKVGVFLHACFQVTFLTVLGAESGRLEHQKQAFGVGGVEKTSFPQKLEF